MKSHKAMWGIIAALLFYIIFYPISAWINNNFDGAQGSMIKALQRMVFFIAELIFFVKLYKKDSIRSVLTVAQFRKALPAYVGMLVYVAFYVVAYAVIGAKSWLNTTVPIVVSYLLFVQLSTGLWEEMTFRAFVCEGYYQGEDSTFRRRLIYACISAVIFGILHALECDSSEQAIYRFIITGVWGFSFASVYFYSHNLLAAACIHFFTDIFLNISVFIKEWNESILFMILDNYVQWVMLAVIFIVAVVFLRKEPLRG